MAWIETSRKNPCPICGKAGWCSVTDDGAAVFCHRVDTGQGKHKVCSDGGEGWLYRLNGAPARIDLSPPEQPKAARAADEILYKVYTDLLKNLELSAEHRRDLLRRGLTQEAIDANCYRTLPLRGRSRLAKTLIDIYGQDVIASVPGFYVNNSGKPYWSLGGAPGILIPVRNLQGQIIGLKIRLDDPGEVGKYAWLSSKKHGGPGPANSVHVPKFSGDTSTVRVTEGELKADVATVLGGILTISIPGVSCWRQAAPVLKKLGARTVLVSFDADAGTNPHVARALKNTIHELTRKGFQVFLEKWDIRDGKGIDDLLTAGKKPELVAGKRVNTKKSPEGFTDVELLTRVFPGPNWVIRDLLPTGLTVLGGKSKIGKSWLGLGVAVAVASGGRILGRDVGQSGVAYLALEDSPRRLKERLTSVLQGSPPPGRITFFTSWPRLDQDGLALLQVWLLEHPEVSLVIIDVLQKIRPPRNKNAGVYEDDYQVVGGLKSLADERGIAILLLHHLSKNPSSDPLDTLSGSTGIPGAADCVWILRRDRGKMDAVLHIIGRDVQEQQMALEFDRTTTTWQLLGDAEEYRLSQESQDVLDIFREAKRPLSPKDVSVVLGKSYQATAQLLYRLSKSGLLQAIAYGKYIYPPYKSDQCNVGVQSCISDQSDQSKNDSYIDRRDKYTVDQEPQGLEGICEGEV